MSDNTQGKQFILDNWKLWSHQDLEYAERADRLAAAVDRGLVNAYRAGLEAAARAVCHWCEIEGQKVDGLTVEPAHDEGEEGWFHCMTGIGRPYDGDPQECSAAAIRALAAGPVDTPETD